MPEHRIGYVLSEYPKISHTFIRREIEALESAGIPVERFAIRGSNEDWPDPADQAEASRTRQVLASGLPSMLGAMLEVLLRAPRRTLRALALATRMGWHGDRPIPVHWIYLLEAALIAKWARESAVTHLHAHFGSNPAEVAMLAAELSGIGFSFTAHGTVETDNAVAIKLSEKIRRATFVVAVSEYGRAQMMRWIPFEDWQKIHVVHCGIGADFLEHEHTDVPDVDQFVTVGRLSGEKGHLVLIDALARLIAQGHACRLVMVGDGPLRGAIEQRCHELGIERFVNITGWQSGETIREWLIGSRALILPSFAEGLPVVIMESLALGRPVIASWVAGVPELVRDGHTGWLVPPGDATALANAMKACLALQPTQMAAMANAGKTSVRKAHDARIEAQKLMVLLTPTNGAETAVPSARPATPL
ncbi:MAG: glycosyltransferase family 4 protein [Hydrogenophaga sp.]|uniref:glycosyltransferase family 4 protein n=1 Tax=Hydrogenophaga sp. TaxID=1904254 RepID=UPI0026246C69|nr:glycosyltransferase family 4 protein [Hydrogenophaga sp.]MCV0440840.1 glycosyltransferase family 4 protein [Hydrogenophaga sp.]